MLKCLVLAVDVGKEVLRSLWEIQDGLQIYDFCGCFSRILIRLGKQS